MRNGYFFSFKVYDLDSSQIKDLMSILYSKTNERFISHLSLNDRRLFLNDRLFSLSIDKLLKSFNLRGRCLGMYFIYDVWGRIYPLLTEFVPTLTYLRST